MLLQLVTEAGILSVQEQNINQDISPNTAHSTVFSSNINEVIPSHPKREEQSMNPCELDELKSAECKYLKSMDRNGMNDNSH